MYLHSSTILHEIATSIYQLWPWLDYLPQSTLCEDPVYMHFSSALLYTNTEFVVFQDILDSSKLYMRGVCM